MKQPFGANPNHLYASLGGASCVSGLMGYPQAGAARYSRMKPVVGCGTGHYVHDANAKKPEASKGLWGWCAIMATVAIGFIAGGGTVFLLFHHSFPTKSREDNPTPGVSAVASNGEGATASLRTPRHILVHPPPPSAPPPPDVPLWAAVLGEETKLLTTDGLCAERWAGTQVHLNVTRVPTEAMQTLQNAQETQVVPWDAEANYTNNRIFATHVLVRASIFGTQPLTLSKTFCSYDTRCACMWLTSSPATTRGTARARSRIKVQYTCSVTLMLR